ncbi:MAG TPA: hypothetical protein VEV19_11345 [Ktedonobacteraceae bacterium]|nr:hypothetical protein [Ktedonobacteraceae bacterium]
MPVVINEFEVLSEPPPERPEGEGRGRDESRPYQQMPPTPHEIEVVMRYLKERLARVRDY